MSYFLQLSDIHLLKNQTHKLGGINTQETLEAILKNAISQKPDFVILSGDLSEDGSLASYERLAQTLTLLPCPVYWTLGNHDDPYSAKKGLAGNNLSDKKSIVADNWLIILLDSIAPGLEDGFLGDVDFAHLHENLKQHPEKPAIIILHHPPVKIGCYMDEIRLINDEKFLTVISNYPQIQAVLFGHIHQPFEKEQQGISFIGAPSTCVQFQPNRRTFAIDSALTPGYRWVEFTGNQLTTDIIRI